MLLMRSRGSSTVTSTLRDLLAIARIQVDLGILPTGADQSPWPVGDFTGMGIAVAMLRNETVACISNLLPFGSFALPPETHISTVQLELWLPRLSWERNERFLGLRQILHTLNSSLSSYTDVRSVWEGMSSKIKL